MKPSTIKPAWAQAPSPLPLPPQPRGAVVPWLCPSLHLVLLSHHSCCQGTPSRACRLLDVRRLIKPRPAQCGTPRQRICSTEATTPSSSVTQTRHAHACIPAVPPSTVYCPPPCILSSAIRRHTSTGRCAGPMGAPLLHSFSESFHHAPTGLCSGAHDWHTA